jgi:hypothetical protein
MTEHLGVGEPVDLDDLDAIFAADRSIRATEIETELGEAHWYTREADPYPPPTTPVDAPLPTDRPTVSAIRHLWLATYNPASPDFYDPVAGTSHSDVLDESIFPWSHPEIAAAEGNFWLSTVATSSDNNRPAIEAISVGDLVVVQRSDPKSQPHLRKHPRTGTPFGATDMLVGIALAERAEEWTDAETGRRERRVSLLPAAEFTWPVPRQRARRDGRLHGESFAYRPQLPDGSRSRPGFTLSVLRGDDIVELLGVCGIHPDTLAEPDLAVLAARLRATATGNKTLWRFRYDHVVIHALRRKHERAAVAACKEHVAAMNWVYRESAEARGLAGFDLLFEDAKGNQVEVEVKGYTSPDLAKVRLQPSQEDRARTSVAGHTPPWFLYALLAVDSRVPDPRWLPARDAVNMIDSGGLQVRR